MAIPLFILTRKLLQKLTSMRDLITLVSFAVLMSGCAGELSDEEKAMIGPVAVNNARRLPNQDEGQATPSGTELAPSELPQTPVSEAPAVAPATVAPTVPTPTTPMIPAECRSTQDSILTMVGKCGGAPCHGAGSVSGDFSVSLDALVDAPALSGGACSGRKYIDTANPEQSLILLKLGAGAPCGLPMPLGAPLTPNEDTCLRAWVAGVATGERP